MFRFLSDPTLTSMYSVLLRGDTSENYFLMTPAHPRVPVEILFPDSDPHRAPCAPWRYFRADLAQTVRVAVAGEMAAPRRAGTNTESWPIVHNATTPPTI